MRHLLSYSVYQGYGSLGADPPSTVHSAGFDGIELLTSYDEPDPDFRGLVETVHLPYAPDWLAAWEDRPAPMSEERSLYQMYGRCRDDVIGNVTTAIERAASLSPAHGVFHACNADTREVFRRRYTRDDRHVVDALCDLLNEVVGAMPGGEPPYRLVLENLWWPGLRLIDESGVRILERRLEFEGWGICLDTGHMMSCLPVTTQAEAIDAVLDVVHGYGRGMLDRVSAVHLHWSASYGYRTTFEERDADGSEEDFLSRAYGHVSSIDTHTPFSDPRCAEIVDVLEPDFLIHELPGTETDMWTDLAKQRALFPDRRD